MFIDNEDPVPRNQGKKEYFCLDYLAIRLFLDITKIIITTYHPVYGAFFDAIDCL